MKRSRLLLGSTVALLLAWQQAGAEPLDAETCGKLNGERVQLEFAGAGTNMAKGPEWAKANLSADAVKQVMRLIDVEAQLLFRCAGPNLINLPTEAPDPAAVADTAKASDAAKGEASAKAKPKSGAAKKAAAKEGKADGPAGKAKKGSDSKAAARSDAGKAPAKPAKREPAQSAAGKAAAAKPGDKGKGNAKVDDAYKPPPADPKANPFAGQAPPPAK